MVFLTSFLFNKASDYMCGTHQRIVNRDNQFFEIFFRTSPVSRFVHPPDFVLLLPPQVPSDLRPIRASASKAESVSSPSQTGNTPPLGDWNHISSISRWGMYRFPTIYIFYIILQFHYLHPLWFIQLASDTVTDIVPESFSIRFSPSIASPMIYSPGYSPHSE